MLLCAKMIIDVVSDALLCLLCLLFGVFFACAICLSDCVKLRSIIKFCVIISHHIHPRTQSNYKAHRYSIYPQTYYYYILFMIIINWFSFFLWLSLSALVRLALERKEKIKLFAQKLIKSSADTELYLLVQTTCCDDMEKYFMHLHDNNKWMFGWKLK